MVFGLLFLGGLNAVFSSLKPLEITTLGLYFRILGIYTTLP